jgi:hypothetical protein
MNIPRFIPLAPGLSVALLAACGGSQPPIGAPGAMPQSRVIATHAEGGGSWMLPEAKKSDLLYISNLTRGVTVFSYPELKLVGSLTILSGEARGMCTDKSGDVFVTASEFGQPGYLYEYSHGGTKPIRTLTDPGEAIGCSVDRSTGDLAATNFTGTTPSSPGDLVVYKRARGKPKVYSDSKITAFSFCAYDGEGNLFADPYPFASNLPSGVLAELPAGSASITHIALTQDIRPTSLQWSGDKFIALAPREHVRRTTPVYEITIAGTVGHVSAPVLLGARTTWEPNLVQLWLQGHTLIGPCCNRRYKYVNYWKYPEGGKPIKSVPRGYEHFGAVVSLAPR